MANASGNTSDGKAIENGSGNGPDCIYNIRLSFRKELSQQERTEFYNKWAIGDQYEKDVCPSIYKGPSYVAHAMDEYFKDNKNVKILDVAAGTGFVGEQLQMHGFTNVDALDPAEKMLEVARKKSVYKNIICDFFGGGSAHIADDSYGALVSCGSMGEGHLPCESLKEMSRVVKPGGIVAIIMRKEYLMSVQDYNGRLEPMMSEMEESGHWRLLERKTMPNYFMKKNGILYIFEVLSHGFEETPQPTEL